MTAASSSSANEDDNVCNLIPPANNYLCEFDFTSLEELDPSLCGGWQIVYDREVPGEIRVQNSAGPAQVGTVEPLNIKILIRGTECNPEEIKVELTSDQDLFLHYSHTCDEAGFTAVSEQQRLLVELMDYPTVIMKMANSAIREPHW